jgi:hypothetical protein
MRIARTIGLAGFVIAWIALLLALAASAAHASEEFEGEPVSAERDLEPAPVVRREPAPAGPWGTISFLGREIEPGSRQRLQFAATPSFTAALQDTLVLVTRGSRPGPTLCLTAAIHGDEINGVEIARAVLERTQPSALRGMLVALPIVNAHGFRRGDRFLADRRDLNRFFPGSPRGSNAQRLAHEIFSQVILRCDAAIDLHTGSLDRTNLPQVRADLSNPAVAPLAEHFGVGVVIDAVGPEGSLRRTAVEAGVPPRGDRSRHRGSRGRARAAGHARTRSAVGGSAAHLPAHALGARGDRRHLLPRARPRRRGEAGRPARRSDRPADGPAFPDRRP